MSVDIDGAKARLARYRAAVGPGGDKAWEAGQLARLVPDLVDEVEQLREQVATSAVNGLVVRPGDTLIIALNKTVNPAEADRVAARFADALPDVVVAMVDSVAGLAVYRPNGVESAAIDPDAGDHPGVGLLDRDALVSDGEGRVESSQARGAETPR